MTKQEAWAEVVKQANAGDVEETLRALSAYFAVEAEAETHKTVVSILKGLSDTMRSSATDYYVSLK